MSVSPTSQPMPASHAVMPLSFYAPDSRLAQRLAGCLQGQAQLQWIDSGQVTPFQLVRSGHAGPVLLLDFSPEHAAVSAALAQKLADVLPEGARVAVGAPNAHPATVLVAMRAGLHDFIDIDAPPEDTFALLRKVMERAGEEQERQRQAAVLQAAPVAARSGRLILVKGVRSGVGASTLVAHLGVLAQQRYAFREGEAGSAAGARHVLLMDLGRPSGDLGLYLGVESRYHYEDLLRSAQRIDSTLVRTALAADKHGTTLVGQPANTLAPPPGGSDVSVLGERLRGLFDVILCDLGGLPDEQVPGGLLRDAEEVWLVADASIGALVSLDTALHELERNGMRDARVKLIVNRHIEDAGVSAEQISRRFELPLLAVIPERLQALRSSASLGQLLIESGPRDVYLRALAPLLDLIAPVAEQASSLIGRLGISRWAKK